MSHIFREIQPHDEEYERLLVGYHFKCKECGLFVYRKKEGYFISEINNSPYRGTAADTISCNEFTIWDIIG